MLEAEMPYKHMVTDSRCISGLDCEYATFTIAPWPQLCLIKSVKGRFFDLSGIFAQDSILSLAKHLQQMFSVMGNNALLLYEHDMHMQKPAFNCVKHSLSVWVHSA